MTRKGENQRTESEIRHENYKLGWNQRPLSTLVKSLIYVLIKQSDSFAIECNITDDNRIFHFAKYKVTVYLKNWPNSKNHTLSVQIRSVLVLAVLL